MTLTDRSNAVTQCVPEQAEQLRHELRQMHAELGRYDRGTPEWHVAVKEIIVATERLLRAESAAELQPPSETAASLEEYRLDLVDAGGTLRDVVYLDTRDHDHALIAAREQLAAAAGCLYGHLYTTDHVGEIYVDTVTRPGA